jgi:hypothetical protein
MTEKLKKSYQLMIDWNLDRIKQNCQSQKKLALLLAKLGRYLPADPVYDKDVDDLESLRIIFETSIRTFEGQVEKYTDLLKGLSKK